MSARMTTQALAATIAQAAQLYPIASMRRQFIEHVTQLIDRERAPLMGLDQKITDADRLAICKAMEPAQRGFRTRGLAQTLANQYGITREYVLRLARCYWGSKFERMHKLTKADRDALAVKLGRCSREHRRPNGFVKEVAAEFGVSPDYARMVAQVYWLKLDDQQKAAA